MLKTTCGWLLLLACIALGCGDDTSASGAGLGGDAATPASCAVKGISVACVGPAGCKGGQVCKADGSFDTCECKAGGTGSVSCGAAGVVVACQGKGCLGAQVCQNDGMYSACLCPPAAVALELSVTAPLPDTVVKGKLLVKGTANKNTLAVGVSVANRSFVAADGTTKWSFELDTTKLPNGTTTIAVLAVGAGGVEARQSFQVQIHNVDVIAGGWQADRSPSCQLYFFESGAFVDACGLVQAELGLTSWQREGTTRILLTGTATRVIEPVFANRNRRMSIVTQYRGTQSFTRFALDPDDAGTENAGY